MLGWQVRQDCAIGGLQKVPPQPLAVVTQTQPVRSEQLLEYVGCVCIYDDSRGGGSTFQISPVGCPATFLLLHLPHPQTVHPQCFPTLGFSLYHRTAPTASAHVHTSHFEKAEPYKQKGRRKERKMVASWEMI